jgi:SH3-like domain-containing protein
VRSVSRDWVVVRAGASKKSRIIASIGPKSRVELGETVGSWRRIRARGVNGWVEPRNSFELLASR